MEITQSNENDNDQMEIENKKDEETQSKKKEKNSLIRFPLSKIKNIIKLDSDIKLCQKNAYIIIGKLTELFIKELASNAHSVCKNAKRKTISMDDINIAIKRNDKFGFIEMSSIFHIEMIEKPKSKRGKTIEKNDIGNNVNKIENEVAKVEKSKRKNRSQKKNINKPLINMTLEQMFYK